MIFILLRIHSLHPQCDCCGTLSLSLMDSGTLSLIELMSSHYLLLLFDDEDVPHGQIAYK